MRIGGLAIAPNQCRDRIHDLEGEGSYASQKEHTTSQI